MESVRLISISNLSESNKSQGLLVETFFSRKKNSVWWKVRAWNRKKRRFVSQKSVVPFLV